MFISKATMEKFEGFKISDDCSPGVLGRVGSYLQDLATVLDEVGLETLAVHVGIVFRHDLLPWKFNYDKCLNPKIVLCSTLIGK